MAESFAEVAPEIQTLRDLVQLEPYKPRFRRRDLATLFNEMGYKVGAEVGVAGGRYSQVLCERISDLKLFCVDPWDKSKYNRRGGPSEQHYTNYDLTKERLQGYDYTMIRAISMDGVKFFEDSSLDFVYIDANHDFDFVMEDLVHWTRKVKKGGIVSGHDYYNFNNSGVVEAVNVYTRMHDKKLFVTDKEVDREASWWFKR